MAMDNINVFMFRFATLLKGTINALALQVLLYDVMLFWNVHISFSISFFAALDFYHAMYKLKLRLIMSYYGVCYLLRCLDCSPNC